MRPVSVIGIGAAVASLSAIVAHSAGSDGEISNAAHHALASADDGGLQRKILSDGMVTAEEHREALSAAVNCIRQAGFDARIEGEKHQAIGIFGAVSHDVVRDCQAKHLDAVAFAWADQVRPSEQEYQAIHENTTECFIANGGRPSVPVLTWVEIQAILSRGTGEEQAALGPCLTANQEQFGVPY